MLSRGSGWQCLTMPDHADLAFSGAGEKDDGVALELKGRERRVLVMEIAVVVRK
jgi:hypothetical protein